jgi:hypothetical protein
MDPKEPFELQNIEAVETPEEEVKEELAAAPEAEVEAPEGEQPEVKEEEAPDDENKSLDELPLPETNADNKKELPKYVKNKLEKKDREITAKEAEIAVLREQIQRQGAPNQAPVFNPNIAPPKRDDFQNEDDYIDARIEYKQKLEYLKHQTASQQQQAMNAELSFGQKLKEAQDAGSDSYEDFEEVVKPLFSAGFPCNRAMAEAILDSPYKHDIFYFLGKNIDKAREIAQLNPVQAIKKIADIDARFQARKAQAATSKAPAPITSIKTNNASALLDINKVAQTGSQRDFEAMVNKINNQKVNPW